MSGERRAGYTLLELIAAVLILAMVSAASVATWSISVRAPANKRVTEMAIFVGVQEIERLKALKYLGLADTGTSSDAPGNPIVTFYDRNGSHYDGNNTPYAAAQAGGYRAHAWVYPFENRDGVANTEDLREIRVDVLTNDAARSYLDDPMVTLLTFGGL